MGIGSGLFNYTGSGAVSASSSNIGNHEGGTYYVDNPFSKKATISYDGFVKMQSMGGATGVFMGVKLGYQVLRSESNPGNFYTDVIVPGTGTGPQQSLNSYQTDVLINTFINFNPYIGRKLSVDEWNFSFLIGTEAGFGINSTEKASGNNGDVSADRNLQHVDWRLKPGVSVAYKWLALDLSYAHGLSNYIRNNSDQITGQSGHAVYSQYFNAELAFRL